jgi:hypothetical protein
MMVERIMQDFESILVYADVKNSLSLFMRLGWGRLWEKTLLGNIKRYFDAVPLCYTNTEAKGRMISFHTLEKLHRHFRGWSISKVVSHEKDILTVNLENQPSWTQHEVPVSNLIGYDPHI